MCIFIVWMHLILMTEDTFDILFLVYSNFCSTKIVFNDRKRI